MPSNICITCVWWNSELNATLTDCTRREDLGLRLLSQHCQSLRRRCHRRNESCCLGRLRWRQQRYVATRGSICHQRQRWETHEIVQTGKSKWLFSRIYIFGICVIILIVSWSESGGTREVGVKRWSESIKPAQASSTGCSIAQTTLLMSFHRFKCTQGYSLPSELAKGSLKCCP